MHYLLIRKKSRIDEYRKMFDRTKKALENKETPVFCEMASAKTNLAESTS